MFYFPRAGPESGQPGGQRSNVHPLCVGSHPAMSHAGSAAPATGEPERDRETSFAGELNSRWPSLCRPIPFPGMTAGQARSPRSDLPWARDAPQRPLSVPPPPSAGNRLGVLEAAFWQSCTHGRSALSSPPSPPFLLNNMRLAVPSVARSCLFASTVWTERTQERPPPSLRHLLPLILSPPSETRQPRGFPPLTPGAEHMSSHIRQDY